MTEINEMSKMCYNEIVEIVTSTDPLKASTLLRMGAIMSVTEMFEIEIKRIGDKLTTDMYTCDNCGRMWKIPENSPNKQHVDSTGCCRVTCCLICNPGE